MRYLLLVIGVLVLFGGINDTMTSTKNPDPIEMTVAELAAAEEKPIFVKLTDAKINLIGGVIVGKKDKSAEEGEEMVKKAGRIYAPVESTSTQETDRVSIVLNSQDSTIMETVDAFYPLSAGEQLMYFAKNQDKLQIETALVGKVGDSSTLKKEHREKLASSIKGLDEEFIVISHNFLPSVKRGLAAIGIGGVLLLLSLVLIVKKKKKAA